MLLLSSALLASLEWLFISTTKVSLVGGHNDVCSVAGKHSETLDTSASLPFPCSSTTAVELTLPLDNKRDRFSTEQNHLSYQKLHLRKPVVMLMHMMPNQLASKFENTTPSAESQFLQKRRRFLDKPPRKRSACN